MGCNKSDKQRRAIFANMGYKNTSPKKLKEFANEEAMTSKDYTERGFISQGKDESKHSKFFEKKYKEKINGGK